jgi:hypothetical protein
VNFRKIFLERWDGSQKKVCHKKVRRQAFTPKHVDYRKLRPKKNLEAKQCRCQHRSEMLAMLPQQG